MSYEELIEEFGKQYGIEGLESQGGAAALVIDGIKIDLLSDEAADCAVIYAEIGHPPPSSDGKFGETMLKANHLFGGTGGATLCQNPETGEYAIFQAFPLSALNADSLAAEVARIVDKTEHWRGILNAFQVAERERGETAAEEVLLDAIHGGGFMQV